MPVNESIIVPFNVGDRVQLHPATDAWMRGERYGNVTRIKGGSEMPVVVTTDHGSEIHLGCDLLIALRD